MTDRDYVAEATEQGWKPEEDYTGENWADAQTFVERGEKIAGILKSKNDRLENRIARLESANKEFGEYKDGQLARSEARNKDLLAELKIQRAQAITDGDGAAFDKADREIESVRDNMGSPPTNGNQPNPLLDAWLINNDWYNKDPMLRAIADGVEGQVASEGYNGPAYFAEVTRRVKEMAPDSFGNKKRAGPPDVEAGGGLDTKSDSDAHVYENLPPEAKAACDRFIASGHTTKESYCESYEW
jgi:hypothetical protein